MARLGAAGSYLLVTPVRDEIELLGDLVATVRAQENRPVRWVLVDDGSRDGSLAALEELSRRESWISVVSMPREVVSAEPAVDRYSRVIAFAFLAAAELAEAEGTAYEFVANIDADIRPPPSLLAELLARAAEDRMVGMAACALVEVRDDGEMVRVAEPLGGGLRSGLRVWSRSCADEVASYYTPHWAAVSCLRARNRGFRVVAHTDLEAETVRADGTRNGWWSGYRKFGASVWQVGLHPALVAAAAVAESARDRDLRGLAMMVGYVEGALRREGRCHDPEVLHYFGDDLPKQQFSAWAARLLSRGRARER